jgi:hypothetical protein
LELTELLIREGEAEADYDKLAFHPSLPIPVPHPLSSYGAINNFYTI